MEGYYAIMLVRASLVLLFAATCPLPDPPSASPLQTETPVDFNKVYPWVKHDTSAEERPAELTADVVTKDLIGDLLILYVEDRGTEFKVLFNKHLPEGTTKEKLYALSLTNLRRDVKFELQQPMPNTWMIIAGGDHEAGALCLPELWTKWAAERNGDLLVAPLSKDVVIFCAAADATGKEQLATLATRMQGKLDRPLTKKVLRYKAKTATWVVEG